MGFIKRIMIEHTFKAGGAFYFAVFSGDVATLKSKALPCQYNKSFDAGGDIPCTSQRGVVWFSD